MSHILILKYYTALFFNASQSEGMKKLKKGSAEAKEFTCHGQPICSGGNVPEAQVGIYESGEFGNGTVSQFLPVQSGDLRMDQHPGACLFMLTHQGGNGLILRNDGKPVQQIFLRNGQDIFGRPAFKEPAGQRAMRVNAAERLRLVQENTAPFRPLPPDFYQFMFGGPGNVGKRIVHIFTLTDCYQVVDFEHTCAQQIKVLNMQGRTPFPAAGAAPITSCFGYCHTFLPRD